MIRRVADIPEWNPALVAAVSSGFGALDEILAGGFRPGEVTVWSGANSSGKSTLLGQVMLEAVESGQGVTAYSGELPDAIFRYWLELQAAGPRSVQKVRKGKQGPGGLYRVRPAVVPAIRRWYKDLLFLYEASQDETTTGIMTSFKEAAASYRCRVFLLDNLTLLVSRLNPRDQRQAEVDLMLAAMRFAREHRAHVHLVVHPRKSARPARLGKNDVGGSGHLTNLADNVLVLSRRPPADQGQFQGEARLTVLKNRFGGQQDVDIHLNFEQSSRRFYPVGGSPDREYGWTKL